MDPVTTKLVEVVIEKLAAAIQEGHKLRDGLNEGLEDAKRHLELLMNASVVDYTVANKHRNRKTLEVRIRQIQELACDIEDCLDRRSGDVDQEAGSGPWSQFHWRAKTLNSRTKLAKEIQSLNERLEDAINRKAPLADADVHPPSSTVGSYIPKGELVGIGEPKKQVLDLLMLDQHKILKVVSIVGPHGLGKTALASAMFDSLDRDEEFDCRAWISASDCMNGIELLKKILKAAGGEVDAAADPWRSLLMYLRGKRRYLIVLDDLLLGDWDAIKLAFPADEDTCGRIIVTTSVNRIAESCSSHGGCVYRLQALSMELSRGLLRNIVCGTPVQPSRDDMKIICEDRILGKCNGLPLALAGIGELLRTISDGLTANNILEVDQRMCPALARMQQALVRTYDNLPIYDLKMCFLFLGMCPLGRPIKKNTLVRRWLAEGLVAKAIDPEKKADEYFEELIDRNVIQPVGSSSNARAKTCQVHGVMFDFIVHRSVSDNLMTLVHSDNLHTSSRAVSPRWLSLQNSTAAYGSKMELGIDVSRVRSLAIFNHNGNVLLEFQRCKLLRALDLEDCKELKEDVLDSICELLHLKYLSLRGCTNVSKLPKRMYKLKALETLDTRQTGISMLPTDVLTLPQLAHLFGQFRLPSDFGKVGSSQKMRKFFSERSKLQTLSGFAIDHSPGFEHILEHMSKLRKVKIRCGATAPVQGSSAYNALVSSLKKRKMPIKSLSVDFGDLPITFLYDLPNPCVDKSIKLRGKLNNVLPAFILSLPTLSELRLLSVGLDSQQLVFLGDLLSLRYLKIADDRDEFGKEGTFDVKKDAGFPSLEHLCFETPNLPKVSIDAGAMPKLTYLLLFCKDVEGLAVKDMEKLGNLKEVTLQNSVPAKTREAWEEAAKVHIKRPTIRTYCP